VEQARRTNENRLAAEVELARRRDKNRLAAAVEQAKRLAVELARRDKDRLAAAVEQARRYKSRRRWSCCWSRPQPFQQRVNDVSILNKY
jgi:hypothetical protein